MKIEDIDRFAERVGFPTRRSFSDLSDLYPRLERFASLVAAEKEKQIIDILRRLQERNDSHNYYAYAINVIKGEI